MTAGPAGRWQEILLSALPPAVLVPATDAMGPVGGIACGLVVVGATAVLLAARGRSLRPVIGGLVGVAVSGGLAWYTGSARDAMLLDVWYPLVASVVLTVSLAVGRPLIGVGWALARRVPAARWRDDRAVRCAFAVATGAVATIGGARFTVTHWLYDAGDVGWLAVAKVGLGIPLTAVTLLVVAWAVGRAETRLR